MPLLTAVLSAALVAALLWGLVLPRLTEPSVGDTSGKIAYRDLVTPARTLGVSVLAAAAAANGLALTDQAWWPLWWVLAVTAVPLACVDATTTWIPARPTWFVAAAAVISAVMAVRTVGWGPAGTALLGGVAALVLYWLMWRTGGQFGFGDVRFAPIAGIAAASLSWSGWFIAMAAGPLLTLISIPVRRGLGHQMHPWVPGLLAGPHLALALMTAVG